MKDGENLNIKNYRSISKSRSDGYGGAAILFHKNITLTKTLTNITTPFESLTAEFKAGKTVYKLSSIYIAPNSSHSKHEFDDYLSKIELLENPIIGGDINAKHPLWDFQNNSYTRGRTLANCITSSSLVVLNTGEHTRQDLHGDSTSAIDVTICSPRLHDRLQWRVDYTNLGSDHFPVVIEDSRNAVAEDTIHVNNVKLVSLLKSIDPQKCDTIEELERMITDRINLASFATGGKKTLKYWWNDKIRAFWIIKVEKQKNYNKYKSLYTQIELKKSVAKLKRLIRSEQNCKWNEYLNGIGLHSETRQIWQRINTISNKKS